MKKIKNVEDCFELRLLRKIKPDEEKSRRSLDIAEENLLKTKKLLDLNIAESAIFQAYMVMFHASRALLYKDGVQEKSHFAISIYLKEKYSNSIPLNILNLLDIHRIERHESIYGLEYKPTELDAIKAYEDAKIFLEHIKKIIKSGFGTTKGIGSFTKEDKRWIEGKHYDD